MIFAVANPEAGYEEASFITPMENFISPWIGYRI